MCHYFSAFNITFSYQCDFCVRYGQMRKKVYIPRARYGQNEVLNV